MKRKIAVPIVAVVVAAGVYAAWRGPSENHAIRFAGTIEAQDVEVGSLVGGRVALVHVEEGEAVAAGDPILTFDAELLDAQIQEQRGRLAEMAARLDLLVKGSRAEDVERAKLEWENAERERRRFERLFEGGAASRQQVDDAVTRASLLRETLRALESGSRAEEIAGARAAVLREEGRLAFLARQREEAVVLAPSAGVIQSIDLSPGDLVGPGASVARLLDPADQWVRSYVPEPQLGFVRVGQRAFVTVDSWPDREFGGVVTEVGTRSEYTPRNIQTLSQRNDQVFAVKVRLDPAEGIRPGMAAIVTLEPESATPPETE